MPRRKVDFRGLAETSRVRLLGAVQAAPGSTLKELSEQTGLHVNTAREHLDTLVEEGLVAVGTRHRQVRGRPPSVYSPVTDPADSPSAQERVARARKTTSRLHPIMADDDGDVLGQRAAQQLDMLYEHLADTGLEPESAGDVLEVTLVPCRSFRLVHEDPDFACEVHRRLVRDTLGQVAGPIELEELAPFTEPNLCRLRLRAHE